jgi:1,2-dihydroxy-3-keto-5-methylthiopentene dioxygenase
LRIWIYDENREITDIAEVRSFLKSFGVWYEKWDVEGRDGLEATNEEILNAYAPEIQRLKERGRFVTADVVHITPQTPDLSALLAKFDKEHTHSDDEIRFAVRGSGLFHIHPKEGFVFAVQVKSGDLINVPAGTRHWFHLCTEKTICCIRLFQDKSGWTAHYVDNPIHEEFTSASKMTDL